MIIFSYEQDYANGSSNAHAHENILQCLGVQQSISLIIFDLKRNHAKSSWVTVAVVMTPDLHCSVQLAVGLERKDDWSLVGIFLVKNTPTLATLARDQSRQGDAK